MLTFLITMYKPWFADWKIFLMDCDCHIMLTSYHIVCSSASLRMTGIFKIWGYSGWKVCSHLITLSERWFAWLIDFPDELSLSHYARILSHCLNSNSWNSRICGIEESHCVRSLRRFAMNLILWHKGRNNINCSQDVLFMEGKGLVIIAFYCFSLGWFARAAHRFARTSRKKPPMISATPTPLMKSVISSPILKWVDASRLKPMHKLPISSSDNVRFENGCRFIFKF